MYDQHKKYKLWSSEDDSVFLVDLYQRFGEAYCLCIQGSWVFLLYRLEYTNIVLESV
jgi:hypothetical protein